MEVGLSREGTGYHLGIIHKSYADSIGESDVPNRERGQNFPSNLTVKEWPFVMLTELTYQLP